MHVCLFEDTRVPHLSPLIHTRAVYQIRTGAYTSMVRLWELFERPTLSLHTRMELAAWVRDQTDMPVNSLPEGQGVLFVNGRISLLPEGVVGRLLKVAAPDDTAPGPRIFMQDETVVAAWVPHPDQDLVKNGLIDFSRLPGASREEVAGVQIISRLWHLIDGLQACLMCDLKLLQHPGFSVEKNAVHPSVTMVNPSAIHVAHGAQVHPGAIINAVEGPVFIDADAQVMESAIVKGPVYLGKNSVIKPRADVGGSAIGPICKAGGEVKEVLMQSFSNKAHEGFLGHAYLGSWCNIGAGTNASNLRNDYGETALYNEVLGSYEKTGRQFLGLFMADHSKLGISVMVNTATVFGISCNLFGTGFMPRYLPAFSWGSPETGFETYRLDKAYLSMERIMARRNRTLSDVSRAQLASIHHLHHDHSEIVA